MPPLAIYFIKVISCSFLFYGYYWFFLRNKFFHQFNRVYLLTLVIACLALPFVKINILQSQVLVVRNATTLMQEVTAGGEYIDDVFITGSPQSTDGQQIAWWIYIIICTTISALLVHALVGIFLLKKKSRCDYRDGVRLIYTLDKRAPFSFFSYIFWNSDIDIKSANGRRILKHEMVHVQQKHTHDKIFINVVLIICWCNPIFWLVRKELSVIHEFIADSQTVQDADSGEFAAMVLASAFPGRNFDLTNHFYYSPIKRRLTMLTKNNTVNKKFVNRFFALPLALIVFAAFTLKEKKIIHTYNHGKPLIVVIDAGHGGDDNGAVGSDGSTEKAITLMLAKKVKELNTDENIKILLTRETDIYQSPAEKVVIAKRLGSELFISIHIDNAPASDATAAGKSGFTTFIAKTATKDYKASNMLANAVITSFQANYLLPVAAAPMLPKNKIWILKEATYPAILIEAGFISNNKDLGYLKSGEGQTRFAQNLLNSITLYNEQSATKK